MLSPHPRIQEPIKLVSQKYLKSFTYVRKRAIWSIDCSPCGKFIACGASVIVISFDLLQQKQIVQSLCQHNDDILSIRYSSDGKLIASGSGDYTIIIWDASSLNQIGKILQGHIDSVYSVAFSPDSLNLISYSNEEAIILWDVKIQEQVGESIKLKYMAKAVEYSHSGIQFLSSGYQLIDIWNSKTKQLIQQLRVDKSQYVYLITATYSFDDRFIVSGGNNGSIYMWDTITGQQIGDDLVGHENLESVALSPDQAWMVSGSQDKTVRLWNVKTGKQVSLLHTHNYVVNAVRFTNDGRYVLSGSCDQKLCIIKLRND